MKRFFFAVALLSLPLLFSCAVLMGTRDILVADNYLREKQYNDAVTLYRNMLEEYPDSFYASDARYGLAMALVSADNPQKDYAQALREFEEFHKLYPDDSRVLEVQNWIAVLKTLSDRSRSIEQLKQLDIRHEKRRRK